MPNLKCLHYKVPVVKRAVLTVQFKNNSVQSINQQSYMQTEAYRKKMPMMLLAENNLVRTVKAWVRSG